MGFDAGECLRKADSICSKGGEGTQAEDAMRMVAQDVVLGGVKVTRFD
jgi:hypothetical protein